MLTDVEINILNSVTEGFSKRAKYAYLQSFDEFINKRYIFVQRVENGYELTIEEYTNDLSGRDLVDELLDNIPVALKKKVNILVEPWDKRFESATNVLKEPIFRKDNPQWWWYRIPKKLVGELKEDVEALNIH